MVKKLVTQSYTAGEGEFFDLEREAAVRLLRDGLAEFAAADIAPSGFIAPAWLLGSEAEAAVREVGFDYTTRIATVMDFKKGHGISVVQGHIFLGESNLYDMAEIFNNEVVASTNIMEVTEEQITNKMIELQEQ